MKIRNIFMLILLAAISFAKTVKADADADEAQIYFYLLADFAYLSNSLEKPALETPDHWARGQCCQACKADPTGCIQEYDYTWGKTPKNCMTPASMRVVNKCSGVGIPALLKNTHPQFDNYCDIDCLNPPDSLHKKVCTDLCGLVTPDTILVKKAAKECTYDACYADGTHPQNQGFQDNCRAKYCQAAINIRNQSDPAYSDAKKNADAFINNCHGMGSAGNNRICQNYFPNSTSNVQMGSRPPSNVMHQSTPHKMVPTSPMNSHPGSHPMEGPHMNNNVMNDKMNHLHPLNNNLHDNIHKKVIKQNAPTPHKQMMEPHSRMSPNLIKKNSRAKPLQKMPAKATIKPHPQMETPQRLKEQGHKH